jgi:ankyrin repeat protein
MDTRENLLASLPAEILQEEILPYSGPKTVATLASVSKFFRKVSSNNSFWQEKFKQHFISRVKFFSADPKVDWYNQFQIYYSHTYNGLPAGIKKLFYLVKESDLESLKKINIQLTDLDKKDSNYYSLLYWAHLKSNQAVLNYIYELALTSATKNTRTLLCWAILCHQSEETIDLLLQSGADVNTADFTGATPLYIAAQWGLLGIVKKLLAHNAIVNAEKSKGYTPLSIAVTEGYLDIVKELLDHGADINPKCPDDDTLLHIASKENHLDIVKYLLAHKVYVNAMNRYHATALHFASEENNLDIVKALLAHNANPNVAKFIIGSKDKRITPLHIAAKRGYFNIAKELLDHNTDANIGDSLGFTALHFAVINKHLDIVKELLAHNANVDIKISDEITALQIAKDNEDIDIVDAILVKPLAFNF